MRDSPGLQRAKRDVRLGVGQSARPLAAKAEHRQTVRQRAFSSFVQATWASRGRRRYLRRTYGDVARSVGHIAFIWSAWWNGAYSLAAYSLVPLPGTPIWKDYEQQGRVSATMDFDRLAFKIGGGLPLWIKALIAFPIAAMRARKGLSAIKNLLFTK